MAASAIKPTLIDRIQDRYGRTIYQHDQRECGGCDADRWKDQDEPTLVDRREQVLDPMTAYQITSMMEGVVQRGTGHGGRRSASRSPARPARPTTRRTPGSSASRPTSRSASIIGYDKPRQIGRRRDRRPSRGADLHRLPEGRAGRQAGGAVPRAAGIKLIRVDREDRDARRAGRRRVILEAFKPGTAPPDSYSVIGSTADQQQPDRVISARRRMPTALYAAATGFTEGLPHAAGLADRSGERFEAFAQALDHRGVAQEFRVAIGQHQREHRRHSVRRRHIDAHRPCVDLPGLLLFLQEPAKESRAALGCGESLNVAAVCAQIGVGSTRRRRLPSACRLFFSRRDRFGLELIVTMLSPAEIERETPRWPWIKLRAVGDDILSIQSQP